MSNKEITDLGWKQITDNIYGIDTDKNGINLSLIMAINEVQKDKCFVVITGENQKTFFNGYVRNIEDFKLIMELTEINKMIG